MMLTTEQPNRASLILRGLAAGENAPVIAARLGVAQAAIHQVARKAGVVVPAVRRGPKKLSERTPLSPWHEAIGRAVWRWRAYERDLTPDEFGMMVGLSRYRVLDMEAGTCDLTMSEMQRLSTVIGEIPAMGAGRPKVVAG